MPPGRCVAMVDLDGWGGVAVEEVEVEEAEGGLKLEVVEGVASVLSVEDKGRGF